MPKLSFNGKALKFGEFGGTIYFPTPTDTIVTFTKPNNAGTSVNDKITDNVWLAREDTAGGLFNAILESAYDQNNYLSPLDVEWNTNYTDATKNGWTNYENARERIYDTMYIAFDYQIGNNIVGNESIIHLISDDKFYKLKASVWTSGGLGGGFSYTREEFTPTPVAGIRLGTSDGNVTFDIKLPVGKSVTVNWGDGNDDVYNGSGDTAVLCSHTYTTPGVIYISGDYLDITYIEFNDNTIKGDVSNWSELTNLEHLHVFANTDIVGDVSGWSALTNLTHLSLSGADVYGDISGWSALTNLEYLDVNSTFVSGDVSGYSALTSLTYIDISNNNTNGLYGDISSWSGLTNLTNLEAWSTGVDGDVSGFNVLTNMEYIQINNTSVSGDISSWSSMAFVTGIQMGTTDVTFDSSSAWSGINSSINLFSNNLTSTQVDNVLIAMAGGECVGKTIHLTGTNANRTSASDAAKATLLAGPNTVNVNEA